MKTMKIINGMRQQAAVVTRGLNPAAAYGSVRAKAQYPGCRVRAFFRSHAEGSALVETAMVLPILMSVMLGMFSLTMALYTYQKLGYATFAGAQELGESRGLYSDPCYEAAQTIVTGLPGFTASKLTITMTITGSSGSTAYTFAGNVASGSGCTAAGTGGSTGTQLLANEPATVTVSYAYTWIPMWAVRYSGPLATSETVLVD
jgi:Flp pilus assembly protein TadG